MKIQSGMIAVPVERDGQVVGEIKFNPSDLSMVNKYYGLIEKLEDKEKEFEGKQQELLQDEEKDKNGVPKNAKALIELTEELCLFLRCEVDDIFGSGTCQIVFGDYNNPAMFEQFFSEITPYIQNARSEKVDAHLENRKQRRASQSGKKVMK